MGIGANVLFEGGRKRFWPRQMDRDRWCGESRVHIRGCLPSLGSIWALRSCLRSGGAFMTASENR